MRVRHRIPSIFNLSMVDVLCCALGCVILLWLINLREAKYHEESAEEEHRRVTTELTGTKLQLESRIEALQEEKKAKQAEAADLARRLEESSRRLLALENDLRERGKLHEMETARAQELDSKLKETAGRVAVLEKNLRQSEKRGEKETARGRELAEALATARMRLKELQTTANLVPSLRADLKDAREQYAAEKAISAALEKEIAKRMGDLKDADKNLEKLSASRRSLERDIDARDKELALARKALAALREQNQTLEGETARVRAASENRFAGITLTGRRVLFLVDTSGSMDLVDENTKAPTKWADVGSTIARLMRSLPNLEKYQVIIFSETTGFLFPGEEDWLDFKAQSSPERVRTALTKITPKGGTNMYAALQLAFRLRAKGMDTIYLFSDGLPNLGEGVRPEALNTLREVERNDLLARHIRRTLQSDWNRPLPGQPSVRINTIGFFYESPDVGAFLWALARENDGSFVGMSKP
ncbi:MAG TPA: VWA domain-containing protein [Gemmataceae bacterium]|nr:VWA domain-containing protein [Gemmataceae bacterium]